MGKTGNTLVSILAGFAIGAVAGILIAPDQGDKTRKRIGKTFKNGTDDLSAKFDDLKNQLKGLITDKKNDFEANFDQLIDKAEDKSENVIAALEKKLEELKKNSKKVAEEVKSHVK